MAAFDAVVAQGDGLRSRPGQRLMAEQVACTFSEADLGTPADDDDGVTPPGEPARSIAVIQAGTGVGKSLAYSVPAIVLALARNTRVVISTATVALQEQLVHKDLPALANRLPHMFRFALAKGRGRYVCRLKLERRLASEGGADDWVNEDDLFHELALNADDQGRRQAWYTQLSQELAHERWDGDRDTLAEPPDPSWWGTVAAEASACTARHCPLYSRCSYFEQRKSLVGAQVIVVNHDLLLSSLGTRQLPELDQSLLVLDEAHHLPATALQQFASAMDLSRLTWIDRLTTQALRTGGLLAVDDVADLPRCGAQLRQHLQMLERLVMHAHADALRSEGRVRLPRGVVPAEWTECLAQAAHQAQRFLDVLRAISQALRTEIRDQPTEAHRLSQLYVQLGTLAPRLEAVHETVQWWLQDPADGSPPVAKWLTLQTIGEFVVLRAHASPTLPGATLRPQLWSRARAAVLTSATLTSCGQFDFFLREVGLHGDPAAVALEVASPFDFAAQGQLRLAGTQADPKQAQAFTDEMVQALLRDLRSVQHGALVLFTSRAQLRAAEAALDATLRERVLVQTAWPRGQLLARHRQRVGDGLPSIIFGMQSFGEGLDLPGRLCEDLFITKLPFAPPDDPVGEARAEWLRALGRDPFMELVVPATGIRLAQWVGRAIRTEDDEARVTCYDRRLTQTRYGQRLLQGLPAFTRITPEPSA